MDKEVRTAREIWASHPRWKRVLVYVAFVLLALAALGVVVAPSPDRPNGQPEQADAQKHEKAMQLQFSPWDGSHRKTERAIKDSLDDPDSYQHVETRAWWLNDGTIKVATKFRAKNSHGGVVVHHWESIVTAGDGTVLKVTPLD